MPPSDYEKSTRELVEALIERIEHRLDKLELIVTNHLAHRLPVWATLLLAILTGVIGTLLILAFK